MPSLTETQERGPAPGSPPLGLVFSFFVSVLFLFLVNVREKCVFRSRAAPGPGLVQKHRRPFPIRSGQAEATWVLLLQLQERGTPEARAPTSLSSEGVQVPFLLGFMQ